CTTSIPRSPPCTCCARSWTFSRVTEFADILNMPDLRVVFMGTAELACASLEALCRAPDLRVVAVVTQPDKPKGRELKLQPTPVKVVAVKHELPVHQPVKARAPEF